jgi:hypothetical protein
MKNQTAFEALCGPKPSFVPVFTPEDRANSLEAITKGNLRGKTNRIIESAQYCNKDQVVDLKSIADNLFNYYHMFISPGELFRFRNVGEKWIKHFVIAFELENKWVEYFDSYEGGYKNLPKSKQIFPIEPPIEFDI